MIKKLKKPLIFTLISLMAIYPVGCGKKEKTEEEATNNVSVMGDVTENTVKLSPNGSVVEISCEDYNGTDVDISTLQDYIKKELEDFNTKKGTTKASLLEYSEDNKFVKAAIQYNDFESYLEFNMLNTELSVYKADRVEELFDAVKTATKTDAIDKADVNLEELAEAGYDIEDLENGTLGGEGDEDASATDAVATFTDAVTNDIVAASDISDPSYMMLITNEDSNYVINSGHVVYYNSNAILKNSNTVYSTGNGTAIIVFKYDF